MFSAIFRNTTVPVLEQVVAFNEARHAVLAGNIANIDTPGYRIRDLDVENFRSRLREAISDHRKAPTSSSHRPEVPGVTSAAPPDMADVVRDAKTILRHDDANVGVENQVTEMVKNQLEYNLCLGIMRHQLQQLQTAISERL